MNVLFYVSGAIAVVSALMVVTRGNTMHALVNLIVLFLAIGCVFWTLGAPFAAALQILVYAGAIMVLFVFAVMILNVNNEPRRIAGLTAWIVPTILAAVLMVEFLLAVSGGVRAPAGSVVGAARVGTSLFTTYAIGVEIASVLLLAGLVAAFHYGIIPGRLEDKDE